MKYAFYAVALAMALTGCKKTESTPAAQTNVSTTDNYADLVVGIAGNDGYALQNEAAIKEEWQKKVSAEGLTIASLEIVASKTPEDGVVFYMLLARTNQGAQMAALLTQKEDQLLFDRTSGTITTCNSKAGGDFHIEGSVKNGAVKLYCAACNDCEKMESGL